MDPREIADWLIGDCPRWQQLSFWKRYGIGWAVAGVVMAYLVIKDCIDRRNGK